MNKKIAIIFLLASILLLNSCTFRGGKMILFDEDKVFNKAIETIKKQDKNAFKEMFSKQALAKTDNFDENMDCLFSFFQDGVTSWERTGGPASDEGMNDDGTGRIWKEERATYDIETSEQKYHASIKYCVKDTKNSDNVGVYSICIINAKDWTEDYNYWGDLKTLGINID